MLRKDQFTICDLSPRPEIKYVSSQHDGIDFTLRCSILTLAEKSVTEILLQLKRLFVVFAFLDSFLGLFLVFPRPLLWIVLTVVDCENFYNGPVAL